MVYEKMTALANAIREKTGGTDLLTLDGMAEAVNGLEIGGGGDIDALIDGSITEVSINAESIRNYAFYRNFVIESINLPKATNIGESVFTECKKLKNCSLPLVSTSGVNCFDGCITLNKIKLPLIKSVSNYCFRNCYVLQTIDLPLATKIGSTACFYKCYSLKALILRSETICTLSSSNSFGDCYHLLGAVNNTYNPNGDKDCYIYVPRALIEDYKVATNWTTHATQFRALEDYTVDGTITGELDESKI